MTHHTLTHHTLIQPDALLALLHSAQRVVLLDCGFDLTDATAGANTYQQGHLPGAVYAHLEHDLSGAKTGRNGRHPLPERARFAAQVGAWGIAPGVQVVAYDAQGGPYAARAWWLLRWLGHAAVAVLDGGAQAWQAAGGSLTSVLSPALAQPPYPASAVPAMPAFDVAALQAQPHARCIIDARAGERFRGEVEPLDPVAGHIPGARNRFFKDNLQADGSFKPAAELRATFSAFGPAGAVVHQCGSGVTACHNLLAMEHAGLAGSALYPGSWSEWCADAGRPVARG